MPTFEFDDGPTVTGSFLNNFQTFIEDGVTFTMSVSNLLAFQVFSYAPLSGGRIAAAGTTSNGATGDFRLGLTDPNGGFSGSVQLNLTNVNGNITIEFDGTTPGQDHTVMVNTATVVTAPNARYSEITFTFSGQESFRLNDLTADIFCFCAGTRIATVDGFKEVQDLVPGDRLRLADGGETEVRWLGRQSVSKTFADPRRANPICITAGALENERDLHVSPDHGIAVDGYLVNASALVNGQTIYQVAEMAGDWTYYHVETEAHEVILAEGIPTESYVDLPSREVFDNGHDRADAPRIEPMALPRISSARLIPTHLRSRVQPSKAA